MGSFKFETSPASHTLNVTVEGSFSQEDAARFVAAYNDSVSKFNPQQYEIVLDCTTMNVTAPGVVPMLEQCYVMYKESGFKNVVFIIAKNPVLKMQLSRVARNTKLEHYEIREV
ncbi:hypothetical protein [Paenibacillus rhizophilus]|uniref:STAS domain-containing protein n=1 Tax=Paenibacillus rhizophilus TaxID=1850366 RepID=A0A3N9P378_9BACL|nr:hypothetical protein [Paenibacillus rhizophilus]RQW09534.1 hypothetical protein EH198_18840 [Paenibacillus rhizophilus]